MEKCNCWDYDSIYHGRCLGTKEQDPCSCNGDKSKCDFYEHVRQEAQNNDSVIQADVSLKNGNVSAVDFLKEKKRMCKSYDDCHDCPIWEDNISCDDWICDNPELAIPVIMKWAAEHPRPITWNQWLHYLYNYYRGFSNTFSFMDWLNTPIPLMAKQRYNIPEELK